MALIISLLGCPPSANSQNAWVTFKSLKIKVKIMVSWISHHWLSSTYIASSANLPLSLKSAPSLGHLAASWTHQAHSQLRTFALVIPSAWNTYLQILFRIREPSGIKIHLESWYCHLWDSVVATVVKTPGIKTTQMTLRDSQTKEAHRTLGRSIGEYIPKVWYENLFGPMQVLSMSQEVSPFKK